MHCTSFFGKFMLFMSFVLFWVQFNYSLIQAFWVWSAFPIVFKCMDHNCLMVLVFVGKTNMEVNSWFLPWEHWVKDGRPWTSEMTVYLLPCSKIKLCPCFTYFLISLVFVIWGDGYTSKKNETNSKYHFLSKMCLPSKIYAKCLCCGESKDKPS